MADFNFVSNRNKRTATLLLAVLLVLVAYSNIFNASWHMDDYPNILLNPMVQLSELDLESLFKAIGIDRTQGNNLSRPVANLSFALNWYLHGTNVTGFHLVNLLIHIYNVLLIYSLILLIGKTPGMPDRYQTHVHSIALGAGLLWALNPIQTQAVTYVVQRMTSLATLFYLTALIAYIKLRLTNAIRPKIWWAIGTGVAFLFALGTKENAATLPLAIVLIEWIFFRNNTQPLFDRQFGMVIVTGIIFTTLFVTVFFLWSGRDIDKILTKSFEMRPFSQMERVLTQPRVLLFYLSLLFYPIPQRLSLEHDFSVSTSLWHPWSTLPAILVVGSLIALGVCLARKRPLLAFAVLFFFLNHAVESSFLPLEMVFEHRNYLPSVFLFLPVAAGWMDLKNRFKSEKTHVVTLLRVIPVVILISLGSGTYIRNLAWQSEGSLWTDTQRKAPGRTRPLFNLARELERQGNYAQAIILYKKSMSLTPPRRKHFDIMALTNIGTIFYKAGDRDKAITYYREALDLLPETPNSRYNMAVAYANTGRFKASEEHLSWLLERRPDHEVSLDLMALIRLKQHRFAESLHFSRRLLQLRPDHRTPNLQIGAAYTQMGEPAKGAWFLRRASRADPGNLMVMLCMLENRLAAEDMSMAELIREDILDRHAIGTVESALSNGVNESGHPDTLMAYLAKKKSQGGDTP